MLYRRLVYQAVLKRPSYYRPGSPSSKMEPPSSKPDVHRHALCVCRDDTISTVRSASRCKRLCMADEIELQLDLTPVTADELEPTTALTGDTGLPEPRSVQFDNP